MESLTLQFFPLKYDFQRKDNLSVIPKTGRHPGNKSSSRIRKTVSADICGSTIHVEIRMVKSIVKLGSELHVRLAPRQREILEKGCVLIKKAGLAKSIARKCSVKRPIYRNLATERCSVRNAQPTNRVIYPIQRKIKISVRRDGVGNKCPVAR